ncbi:non-ribosomal peptide synthetase [Clostridium rectalis]|uniref:non-ribosomal peptide synthetase n=1 Tax=Clostridium rectalis TaxID=2040295 RepID=UPI000F63CF45|nr:non-ribosomal peptide synthetase [Clostridium rectalis]
MKNTVDKIDINDGKIVELKKKNNNETLIDFFYNQLKQNPNKVALSIKDRSYSYYDIDIMSNAIALEISKKNFTPKSVIAVLIGRSENMITSILAILKAGHSFLPIDVNLPENRIKHIILDSGAKMVLIEEENNKKLLSNLSNLKNIIINTKDQSEIGPITSMSSEDVAYILYTSGTTGRPKGVMVKHMGIVNFIKWKAKHANFTENSVMLQKATCSFDAAVGEIFLALFAGVELRLLTEDENNDFGLLLNAIRKYKVTHMVMVPTVLSALLDYSSRSKMDDCWESLKKLYVVGEASTIEFLKKFCKVTKKSLSIITNLYGPTESSICTTYYDFSTFEALEEGIPIGKPLPNINVYVMSQSNQLCDIDEVGELWIGGIAVAKGYINNEELNKTAFIENPFCKDSKVYCTGDLVKRRSDGNLIFMGRLDNQIKINGQRVEIEEIRDKYLKYSSIEEVAIVPMKDDYNNIFLCAYYICKDELNVESLESYLRKSIPEYMVPRYSIKIDSFPYNINGKLDITLLPNPSNSAKSTQYIAAEGEKEEVILSVWENVLRISPISVYDNFFKLGGDSIKAICVASKLREKGFTIPFQEIMMKKTPRDIAKHLVKIEKFRGDNYKISGEVPLTPIQKQYLTSQLENPSHFNQTFLLKGCNLNLGALKTAMQNIVKYHDMLRATYNGNKQIVLPIKDAAVDFNVYNLESFMSKEEVKKKILKIDRDIQSNIDITKGPLVKTVCFIHDKITYVLLAIHHLVVDGISWRIIIEDLNTAYKQLINKNPIDLPMKTTSFLEWANNLKKFSKTDIISSEIDYWNKVSENTNFSYKGKEKEADYGFGKEVLILSKNFKKNLFERALKPYNLKINDILLTALFRAINTVTGNTTVSVCMEGHGRERLHIPISIERTVGWFTTIFPVTASNIGKSIKEDILNTKETLRRVPNKGIGYSVIKAYRSSELLEHSCDITFNYLGEFDSKKEEFPINIEEIEFGNEIDPKNRFGTPITIDGSIVEGHLEFVFQYYKGYCNHAFVEEIKNCFLTELKALVNHCIDCVERITTPSDVGEMDWSIKEFNNFHQYVNDKNQSIQTIIPLTSMQEGILYQYISKPDSKNYVILSKYVSNKDIDPELFEKSLSLLIKRHPSLRTKIIFSNVSVPRQVVFKDYKADFNYIDLLGDYESTKKYNSILSNLSKTIFDLQNDKLIKFILIRRSTNNYELILLFHHIIIDGWCTSIILRDLCYYYYLLKSGQDFSIQLEDTKSNNLFEEWIRKKNSFTYEQDLLYWDSLLYDYNKKAEIRPEYLERSMSKKKNEIFRTLSFEDSNRIRSICKNKNITPNIFFETAWGILLQIYNNSKDVVFGRVVSGRNSQISQINEALGLFINTIPVRVQFEGKERVYNLMEDMQKQYLQSSNHDEVSLADIQNQSLLGGDLIHSLVAFESYEEVENLKADELDLKFLETIESVSIPLTIDIISKDNYSIKFLYDNSLYDETEIQRVSDNFIRLISLLYKNIETSLDKINIISEIEKNKVLFDYNKTSTKYPSKKSVIDLFDEVVLKRPNDVALSYKKERITYADLNKKASNIASKLIEIGVNKGDIVGISAVKRYETLIGLLAILKAGAAYLPLDPKEPLERLEYMVSNSDMVAFLTYKDLEISSINEDISVNKIYLDSVQNNDFLNNVTIQSEPDSLAYVMYTSGTTGNPKGAMITHNNIVRLVKNTNYVDFKNIKTLQIGSLSFDACTFEIWGAWLNGGEVYLPSNEVLLNAGELKSTIKNNNINTMFVTVALFNQLINEDVHTFEGLTQLLVGGDKVSRKPVVDFLNNNPHVKFIDAYGPTESTTFALCQEVHIPVPQDIPIGKPISNTRAYVLSGNRIQGIGMLGELCLGGDGVANGYMKLQELTKEKFILHPELPNEKIYRTGDLVRWLSNGTIEYIGRIDKQVKIRGFRIEIGEVLNALKSLDIVSDAFVKVIDSSNGNYLCAYIKGNTTYNIEFVRSKLLEIIPEYMIPEVIMVVDKFPLNKNGKIDTNKLPSPIIESNENYVEPKTTTQKSVAKAFEKVLGKVNVGLKDDFFTLGGHSIKAMSLSSQIDKLLGVRPLISDIFEARTVEKIADIIEKMDSKSNTFQSLNIKKDVQVEMSPAQKRIYMSTELDNSGVIYNIPILIELDGEINLEKLQEAIDTMCRRHEIFRTNFVVSNKDFIQVVKKEVKVPLMELTVDCENFLINVLDLRKPFNLESEPLIRVYLLTVINGNKYVFFDIHHSIFDGGSVSIFLKELSTLYNHSEIKPLKYQYKDYSTWINGKDQSREKEYWYQKLSDYEETSELMLDFPRNKRASFNGDTVVLKLEDTISKKVNDFSNTKKITPYIVFISCLETLVSRLSRNNNVSIGTALSGRDNSFTSDMIGMFVNTVVIHSIIDSSKNFLELVHLTQHTFLDAYRNQYYPFESIVKDLGVNRTISKNPIFDVMIAMENLDLEDYKFGTTNFKLLELPNKTAKFDLVLTVKELQGQYKLCWDYNIDLFKKSTIERIANSFYTFLKQALENPTLEISKHTGINAFEENRLLKEFVQGEKCEITNSTAVEFFENQVKKSPYSIAISFKDFSMSYMELNKEANKIARKLRDEGVRSGEVVGLFTNRSIEMIIGIYAILKAGATYLPILPDYSEDRINYMLEDCNVSVVLSNINPELNCKYKVVDFYSAKDVSNLNLNINGESMAYIIYTSGTTGKPKGIAVSHNNLMNLIQWQMNDANIGPSSVILQKSNYIFDASVWEIFLSTQSGGCLQLLSDEENADLIKVLEVITKSKTTHMLMVPTVFSYLLDTLEKFKGNYSLDSLKIIFLGAESVNVELIEKYKRVTGKNLSTLRNLYGPTECTVCATCFDFSNFNKSQKIPIGRPIANAKIYILGPNNEICSIGVPGEICIGGKGVSKGYINLPEENKKSFILNPIINEGIIYKTGDLGYWDNNGNIIYLGREDNQIKIRGFRIELEEIRSTIMEINNVEEAVVVVYREYNDMLVAYFIGDADVKKIKSYISKKLPEYMQPSKIISLSHFPTTKSGKLDKKNLPKPKLIHKNIILPNSKEEDALCSIYKEILNLKEVSVNDSFFNLGGHSLLATSLSRKIEQVFSKHITLRDIIENSTIKELAALVESRELICKKRSKMSKAKEVIINE